MLFTINIENNFLTIPIQESPEEGFIVLPARAETIRRFQKINSNSDQLIPAQEIAPGVFISRTIVNPQNPYIQVLNTNQSTTKVTNKIPFSEDLDNYHFISFKENQNDELRTTELLKILEPTFPEHVKTELIELCTEFSDIFALDTDKLTTNNFYKQETQWTQRYMNIEISYI